MEDVRIELARLDGRFDTLNAQLKAANARIDRHETSVKEALGEIKITLDKMSGDIKSFSAFANQARGARAVGLSIAGTVGAGLTLIVDRLTGILQ